MAGQRDTSGEHSTRGSGGAGARGPGMTQLLEPGQVIAEQFEVVRMLGRGGMGVVYESKNRLTGERLALKTILPVHLANPKAVRRFIEEINAARRLHHPNIVAVYDVAREGDQLFFTMEFLNGKSLRKLIDKRGRFNLAEAGAILTQLCGALEYAHQFMVHRDLSPENVMVLEDGTVKLLDFGLARMLDRATMTATGASLGKAHYMSPEQRKSAAHVDKRTDIYAMGVMLFEMLTGKLPVGFETLGALRPDLPKECDRLVGRCLVPADRRVGSAAEFRDEIRTCLQAERNAAAAPVPAAPHERRAAPRQPATPSPPPAQAAPASPTPPAEAEVPFFMPEPPPLKSTFPKLAGAMVALLLVLGAAAGGAYYFLGSDFVSQAVSGQEEDSSGPLRLCTAFLGREPAPGDSTLQEFEYHFATIRASLPGTSDRDIEGAVKYAQMSVKRYSSDYTLAEALRDLAGLPVDQQEGQDSRRLVWVAAQGLIQRAKSRHDQEQTEARMAAEASKKRPEAVSVPPVFSPSPYPSAVPGAPSITTRHSPSRSTRSPSEIESGLSLPGSPYDPVRSTPSSSSAGRKIRTRSEVFELQENGQAIVRRYNSRTQTEDSRTYAGTWELRDDRIYLWSSVTNTGTYVQLN